MVVGTCVRAEAASFGVTYNTIVPPEENTWTWIYCQGHSSVVGNEEADQLAARSNTLGNISLDKQDTSISQAANQKICARNRPQNYIARPAQ